MNKARKVTFTSYKSQRTSLDSHADTCCAGSNMAVLELKEERVNVFPFADEYAAIQDIPIATVATIWENPKNGELWMLVLLPRGSVLWIEAERVAPLS